MSRDGSIVVIRRDALRSFVEAFYMVIIQHGSKRDDKDQVIALCPRRCDAAKVKYALERADKRLRFG